MRTIPAAAKLNKRHARKPIGLRVLNVDRSQFRPFSTAGVTEALPAYYVSAGVQVPDTGGYICWGTSDTIIVESAVQPVLTHDELKAQLSAAEARITQLVSRSSNQVLTQLRALAGLAKAAKRIEEAARADTKQIAALIESVRADSETRLSESTRKMDTFAGLGKALEEAQLSRIGIDEALSGFSRQFGELQQLLASNLDSIAEVGATVTQLSEARPGPTVYEVERLRADSLRAINEAMELLS